MRNHNPVRWGILGPGRIARNVATDFGLYQAADQHGGGILSAVGSRSLGRAQDFAAEFGAAKAYGSYAELIADPDIDALYIATPHPQHLAPALAGIAAGKHLLVEKTFTATVAGAEELIAAARDAGVFCMEAMWTRFQPVWVRIRELLAAGAIGELRQVRADLGVAADLDPHDRWADPAQGGGALLDVGVYVVSLAHWLLGEPETTTVTGRLADTGVDGEVALHYGYPDGRAAQLQCSIHYSLPGSALLVGTDGWIEVPPRFHHPDRLLLHGRGGGPVEEVVLPPIGRGYAHEFAEVHRCLAAGLTESPIMPLADTLAVQRLLNDACERLGVTHHEDR